MKIKIKTKIIPVISCLIIIFLFPSIVAAADLGSSFGRTLNTSANVGGYVVQNTTDENSTIEPVISLVINIVLSLLGIIFLILMIYGGFLWLTAAGEEKKIEKAKSLIISAVIGLIIVLLAYAISIFVVTKFSNTTLK